MKTTQETMHSQYESILRVKDSQIKEREQMIARLQMKLSDMDMIKSESGDNNNNLNHLNHLEIQCNKNNPYLKTSQNERILLSSELMLKDTEIENLKTQISENSKFHQKELNALSRQLAAAEYNLKNSQTQLKSQKLSHEKLDKDTKFHQNEQLGKIAFYKDQNEIYEQKNAKLVARLETVEKYMELLPTREEHLKIERQKNDLLAHVKSLEVDLANERVLVAKIKNEVVQKQTAIKKLTKYAENFKIDLGNSQKRSIELENEKSSLKATLTAVERQKLEHTLSENANLKLQLERSLSLSAEVTNRLAKQENDLQVQTTDVKVELAKERAIAETLRQTLIDQQVKIDKMKQECDTNQAIVKAKDDLITELKLDLVDVGKSVQAIDVLRKVGGILTTVTSDISTIVNIIDRQILNAKKDDCQDIMDVSRLLSCSIHESGQNAFSKSLPTNEFNSTHEKLNEQQSAEAAFKIANRQLDAALKLQDEIDKLRLKLSDRWTDHLATTCHIQ